MKQLPLILIFLIISHLAKSQQKLIFTSYFDLNKSDLNATESNRLSSFLSDSLDFIKVSSISGFTDTVGSRSYNTSLAAKRINSIISKIDLTDPVKSEVVGENYDVSSNYKAREFRKVEISYTLIQKAAIVEIPQKETLKSNSLNSEVNRFLGDEDATNFSFDLSILFYNASDQVLPESYPQLAELLKIMNDNPQLSIIIHGHVCCTKSYDISVNRAKRVYHYLEKNKVDMRRMSYIGHSNDQPKVFPEVTEEDFKLNRRVAIEFVKK